MYLFIADLHLSEQRPRLVRGFLALLQHYQQKTETVHLYILGDWFNAWLGDDDIQETWIQNIISHLQTFQQHGHQIYFSKGNRDFALGIDFLNLFNAHLLPDIDYINIANQKIRIEHGDLLCTDDIQYQRFRKIIRFPLLLSILKNLPLTWRKHIAQKFRKNSQISKQQKDWNIMDVNADAVHLALDKVDILIHGHTHRPQVHHIHNKLRIVLGDWREYEQHIQAQILEINHLGHYQFIEWKYDI